MTEPVLFFSRAKPWGVDLGNLAVEHRRIFFGYPLFRPGTSFDEARLEDCLVSPQAGDDWVRFKPEGRPGAQHSKNANLAALVGDGSIAMIPRAQEGLLYCGMVRGRFRLSNDPELSAKARKLFEAQGYRDDQSPPDGTPCSRFYAAAELAQGWDVEEFVPIPLPLVPAVIRSSLFGRSTYGVVRPEGYDALGAMRNLMAVAKAGRQHEPRPWTLDPHEAANRIRETVTPNQFEALMVSVLQVLEPEMTWLAVGGSGDGGVDGIALGPDGQIAAILQCKWRVYGPSPFPPIVSSSSFVAPSLRRILAWIEGHPASAESIETWDVLRLSAALIANHEKIPMATTLRIGPGPLN